MISFPLNAGTKVPAVASWSNLLEAIEVPDGYNVGILCGAASGIFVVDYDGYKNGTPGIIPDWTPETFTVKTGRGGYHFYFEHPGFFVRNSTDRVKPCVDVRGDGGYVVGPGSRVLDPETGIVGEYTIVKDVPIAPAPAWLLDAVRVGSDVSASGVSVTPITDAHPDYAHRVALAREKCQTHVFHDGANTWEVALYLARFLELPRETCIEILWNDYNPRREVPLSVKQLLHKIDDAQSGKYVSTLPGAPPADLFAALKTVTNTEEKPRGYLYVSGELAASPNQEPLAFADLVRVLNSSTQWEGTFKFNEVTSEIVAQNPPVKLEAEHSALTDGDVDRAVEIFSHEGYKVSSDSMHRAIRLVAEAHAFNPIQDYIRSIKDRPHTDAIRTLCTSVLGSPSSYVVVRKWLISAVRRAFKPGTKADAMLVLQGKQKAGKSVFGEILFGREYFSDQMPSDLANKEASQALRGKWCIEFSELASLVNRRAQREIVRGFITRTEEYYRPPYGRNLIREKRRCVFIGTTNEDEFLDDPFGERRYWIVPVKPEMDLGLLSRIRDEVWSEAYALAQTDERHYLTPEEESSHNEVRENYSNIDPWSVYVTSYLKGRTKAFTGEDIYRERIAKDSIGAIEQLDTKLRKRINDILRRLGCTVTYEVAGKRARGWLAPPNLQNMKPEGRFQKSEEYAN